MQKKYKDHAARQEAYRERTKEKQEAAAEIAEETAKMKRLDLRSLGESGFGQNAESSRDEIQTHRQFLHALGEPDVEPGETLRQLARRTFDAVLDAKGIGVFKSGEDVWVPMFNPRTQKFDGWYGYELCGALKPDWFDAHWQAPDATGDEVISIDLPKQRQA